MIRLIIPFLLLSVFAGAQETRLLHWEDAVRGIQSHEEVVSATTALKLADAEQRYQLGWRGATVELLPLGEINDLSGTMEMALIKIGAELSLPLGFTKDDKEKEILLSDVYALRLKEAEEAYGTAFLDLYKRYVSAYQAQEAVQLAKAEVEYQLVHVDAVRQRLERGLISVSDALEAESTYRDAEAALSQAQLDARLAWFDLMYVANLETPRGEHEPGGSSPLGIIPAFASPVIEQAVLTDDQPLRLIQLAKERSSTVLKQRQAIQSAERDLRAYASVDLHFAPKLSYTRPDGSISVGFSTINGALSVGAGLNPYTAYPLTSSNLQNPDNSISLSMVLSAQLDGGAKEQRVIYAETLELERKRLVYLEAGLELQVRSKYAAYLKALDNLKESARALEAVSAVNETFEAKRKVGQTNPEDEAANRTQAIRAQFYYEKAKVARTQAYFELIDASSAWQTTEFKPWGNNR